MSSNHTADLVVVGAGAAGLATAVFAARAGVARVVCLEGARRVGAKILISGGGRCNVTNREVTERDFWGGSSPRDVRSVLRAFPAERAAEFFARQGVALHEEDDGKLFPDSNRAGDVVECLLRAASSAHVEVLTGRRVAEVRRMHSLFETVTGVGETFTSRAVVLATGGQSLPKSGSDGFGYTLARALGHSCVATTPALAPLVIADPVCRRLSGVSHGAEARVVVAGKTAVALRGAVLWTHFGISGPLALNISRHWLRSRLDSPDVALRMSLCPGESFDAVDQWLLSRGGARPRALVTTVVAERLPQALADAWVERAGIGAEQTMAHLDRDERRRLVHELCECVLPVQDSRGYSFAEVTAGGVPLSEIDVTTMESRVCPGLYLAGEIVDVDGRLGGFNFQWAWSSAWVAGQALGRVLTPSPASAEK
ncbi:MAG: NAD(P)/FAD-dependent oxidoreductase [Vicinamibacterales bacterium]